MKNKQRLTFNFLFFFLLLVLSACVHTDGLYRGKVVELESGKPIEGAVVAARWTIEPFVHTERICDAKETITNENGEFELPKGSCWSHPFAEMHKPTVVVFKPGYLGYPPLGAEPEERKSRMPNFTGNEFRDEKQYYVIKLGKPKTRQERSWTMSEGESLLDEETYEKLPILLKLVNEENKNLGLGQIGTEKSGEKR